jgi:hypothetical protein
MRTDPDLPPLTPEQAAVNPLSCLASAAKHAAQTIRSCFPVAGQYWALQGVVGETATATFLEVISALMGVEILLNPRSLPFDHPGRRHIFRVPDGCFLPGAMGEALNNVRFAELSQLLAAAAVANCYDQVLKHYALEWSFLPPNNGSCLSCGWPDVPHIAESMLEALEQAADNLHGLMAPPSGPLLAALGITSTPFPVLPEATQRPDLASTCDPGVLVGQPFIIPPATLAETSPEQKEPPGSKHDEVDHPPVILNGQGKSVVVWGKEKPALKNGQYQVIEALVKAHATNPDKGLTGQELNDQSGKSDARKILKRLTEADADWERAINFPCKGWGPGYHLRPKPRP